MRGDGSDGGHGLDSDEDVGEVARGTTRIIADAGSCRGGPWPH
jgi:hypothetical protein